MSEAQEVTLELPAPKVRAKKAKTLTVVTDNASVPTPVAPAKANMLDMIERIMVDPNISVERVNQAFDFYQRVKAEAARTAFEEALASAKAEFPKIEKNRLVDFEKKDGGRTTYWHEALSDIDAVVDPILSKYGISSRYRVRSVPNEPVSVTCVLAHKDGHIEENTLAAGADTSGGKNGIQGIGSTITYLQRYTKKASLGLSASRDDDAKKAEATPEDDPITEAQLNELIALADEVQANKAAFCKYYKIESFADITQRNFEAAKTALNAKRKGA